MGARKEGFYTPEEYLALEEQADYKSQYHQGQMVAMAGGTLNHNRITKNTCFAIDNALGDKPCETFIGDVRLWVDRKKMYTYPDVMVVCGEPEFMEGRSDTIINPRGKNIKKM